MKQHRWVALLGLLLSFALVAAACGDDDDDTGTTDDGAATEEPATEEPATDDGAATEEPASDEAAPAPAECETVDDVTLQLQWFIQAQFAGYYAAIDEGFYEAHCLNVTIVEGGVEIVPQQVLADGGADFAIAWVPKALQTRENGANITNIAQIFQRSGTLQVSFADAGIAGPEDFAGKKIGNWGFGNEYEVFAALGQAGLDPAADVELVQQDFNMEALLNGDIDAAEAMIYNEYAQVLEAVNPDTGELYTPEDFGVISYEEIGVGMLQDAIWADAGRLADDPAYADIATRFVAASIEGWAYCRDDAQACADIVVAKGSQLGASHQLWQMNEINKLVWPSASGAGFIDPAAWDRTVGIAQSTPNLDGATVLTAAPTDGAYTNDIVTAAHAMLNEMAVDITGDSFAPIDVTLLEGGA